MERIKGVDKGQCHLTKCDGPELDHSNPWQKETPKLHVSGSLQPWDLLKGVLSSAWESLSSAPHKDYS